MLQRLDNLTSSLPHFLEHFLFTSPPLLILVYMCAILCRYPLQSAASESVTVREDAVREYRAKSLLTCLVVLYLAFYWLIFILHSAFSPLTGNRITASRTYTYLSASVGVEPVRLSQYLQEDTRRQVESLSRLLSGTDDSLSDRVAK